MRFDPRILWSTLLLVAMGMGLRPGPVLGASATALAKDAEMAFEQHLYRECLRHLDDYQKREGELPFELDLLRGRALVRSHLPDRLDELSEQQLRHFLDLVDVTPLDDLRARAAIDLVALHYRRAWVPRAAGLIQRAREYWELHLDPASVLGDYIDYLDAQVRFGGRSYARSPEAAQVWKNLVAAPAPREQLLELATRVLSLGLPGEIREWRWPSWSSFGELETAVSRFVLDGDSAPIDRARAHWILASASEHDGDARASIEHLEWVRDRAVGVPQALRDAAVDRLRQWRRLEAQVQCPDRFRPGSQHPFRLAWRNARRWTLSIEELDPIADLRTPADVRQASLPTSWQDLTAFYEDSHGREVTRLEEGDESEVAARQPDAKGQPHLQREKELWIDPLDVGLYRVRFQVTGFDGEQSTSTRLLRVSTLGMRWVPLEERDKGPAGQLWIVDMESGRAVGQARGRAFSLSGERDRRGRIRTHHAQPIAFETDGTGRAGLALGGSRSHEALAVVAEHNGEPVLGFQYLVPTRPRGSEASETPRIDAFLWSDRPVYRPGESVHVQAVLRKIFDTSRRRAVPAGAEVRLELFDATGGELVKRKVHLSENGSIDESIEIDAEAALGRYRWQLRYANQVFSHSFEVAEVRWPQYAVDVTLEPGFRPVLGDSIRATVHAEYLFGGAVDGEVTVSVKRQPRWRYWRPHPVAWAASRAIRPETPGGGAVEVARYTLSLDERGEARVSIPTTADSGAAGWHYTVVAEVVDSAGRSESGRADVDLSAAALQCALVVDRPIVEPGQEASILLHVEDNLGQSDVVRGRWIVQRRTAEEWVVAATDSVTTDATGEARIGVELEREGIYRMLVEVDDGRDGTSRARTDLWCAGARVRHLEGWRDGLRMMPARSAFLGDRAGVLLLNDAPGTDVLLTTSVAGQVTTRVLRMTGSARWLDFELSEAHRPQFRVHAARAHDFEWAEQSLTVEAPSPSRRLDLALEFEHSELRPGDRARLRVRALDGSGSGVSTIFALAAVDEAVLRVAPRIGMERLSGYGNFLAAPLVPSRAVITRAGSGFAYFDLDDRLATDGEQGTAGGTEEFDRRAQEFSIADTLPEAPRSMAADAVMKESGGRVSADGGEAPVLRSDFRTTAFWGTGIVTDANGNATVEFDLPQTLTRWKAEAVAIDGRTRIGHGQAEVQTRLPVMVRLEHPRVLREGDRVSVVAVVHNETDEDIDASVQLHAEVFGEESAERPLIVAAHGQAQLQWEFVVPEAIATLALQRDSLGRPVDVVPSTTSLSVEVRSSEGGDAVVHQVPVVPMGTPLRVVAHAMLQPARDVGIVDHDQPTAHAELAFELPRERSVGSDLLLAHVTPSVLGGCIQALPYLAEFPQGCTEQTLSRFVPALAVRAVAQRFGLPAAKIDPELDAKVQRGVARISRLMRPDGSWPWWEGGPANLYMSAYAVRSLAIAHELGVHRVRPLLERGARALAQSYSAGQDLDDQAYVLHALALANRQLGQSWAWLPHDWNAQALDELYARRDEISPGPRALLALAEEYRGHHERALSILRHLDNDRQQLEDGTLYWGDRRASWRGRGAVESTAFVLDALTTIDPDSPWGDAAARWLMLNREGRRWHSTRDTAHAILALLGHVRRHGQESALGGTVVFRSGGQELGRLDLDLDALLAGDLTVQLGAGQLHDGANSIGVELLGAGPVWVSLEANTYTQQESITASEGPLRITRSFAELRPVRTLSGRILRAEDNLEGTDLHAGDRVRVRLTLEAIHDLDFVRIVDPRPAGLEPIERLSGVLVAGGLLGRREVGLRGMEFFVDHLPAGTHELVYELVVERSGDYRAEPARMDGMYLPIRVAHSSSMQMHIAP